MRKVLTQLCGIEVEELYTRKRTSHAAETSLAGCSTLCVSNFFDLGVSFVNLICLLTSQSAWQEEPAPRSQALASARGSRNMKNEIDSHPDLRNQLPRGLGRYKRNTHTDTQ